MSEQRLPDWSSGEVIAAYGDGTIVLDDGITTWNPERAKAFLAKRPAPVQDGELREAAAIILRMLHQHGCEYGSCPDCVRARKFLALQREGRK